jgi:glycosyltransferase involved in cell wall biosynthesis
MKVSIILPIYNEVENIPILYKELRTVFDTGFPGDKMNYEIIAVNDASTDGSLTELKKIAANDKNVKVINFRFNSGQTAAMSAGIKNATGEIIIPMDADLQNDPADIPKFLAKIADGYDVVSGWRRARKDDMILRKIPSVAANWLIRTITGVHIHDYGCSMKAYRRDIIQGVNLYGEMHRFIPAYTAWHGGKVTEIVVNHRARIHGTTKYGISRTFKVILDLILVKFLSKYMNRPIHFFGGLGFISLGLGIIAALWAIILKLLHLKDLITTPLPIFAALFIIVGVQLAAMGVIAEMVMRVYYESQDKAPYRIDDTINL